MRNICRYSSLLSKNQWKREKIDNCHVMSLCCYYWEDQVTYLDLFLVASNNASAFNLILVYSFVEEIVFSCYYLRETFSLKS